VGQHWVVDYIEIRLEKVRRRRQLQGHWHGEARESVWKGQLRMRLGQRRARNHVWRSKTPTRFGQIRAWSCG
jgi:hypothetical protein